MNYFFIHAFRTTTGSTNTDVVLFGLLIGILVASIPCSIVATSYVQDLLKGIIDEYLH